jgi:hypothetical protein
LESFFVPFDDAWDFSVKHELFPLQLRLVGAGHQLFVYGRINEIFNISFRGFGIEALREEKDCGIAKSKWEATRGRPSHMRSGRSCTLIQAASLFGPILEKNNDKFPVGAVF